MTGPERHQLIAKCGTVFTPATPVNKLALFAGRPEQVKKVSKTISTTGRHAVMYGDRGVGKSSLANVLRELLASIGNHVVAKVNCAETDDFRNVWKKAMEEVTIIESNSDDDTDREIELSELIPEGKHFGPGEVRKLLQYASSEESRLVIVIDEFDRLRPGERALFADLIKDLSDNSVPVTIMLVGVAKDVVDLIEEHESIERCLMQIPMPPMEREELKDILEKALENLGMTMDEAVTDLIVSLSRGLPHYTHLLGQEAAYVAIGKRSSLNITIDDLSEGMKQALENSQQTIKNDYQKAVAGQRKGTLFPQVLLACALAELDELGFFTSSDVRKPLCQVTKQEYDIPNFAQHLDKFSTDPSRGPVLDKGGAKRRYKFRFRNPLLRPYILMKGLKDGQITGEMISLILEKTNASDSQRLFR